MKVTKEQIEVIHTKLLGEVCMLLYNEFADDADPVVFAAMPSVLRDLADAFEEAIEE